MQSNFPGSACYKTWMGMMYNNQHILNSECFYTCVMCMVLGCCAFEHVASEILTK